MPDGIDYVVQDANGTAVAFVNRFTESPKANATLMAAAPDLYTAIKAMLPWFAPDESAKDCQIAFQEVLDILARAEGKKP